MKKLLGILVLGLILAGNAYSETKFSEIKKALKEDSYGLAMPQSFHALNSPKAKNPVPASLTPALALPLNKKARTKIPKSFFIYLELHLAQILFPSGSRI